MIVYSLSIRLSYQSVPAASQAFAPLSNTNHSRFLYFATAVQWWLWREGWERGSRSILVGLRAERNGKSAELTLVNKSIVLLLTIMSTGKQKERNKNHESPTTEGPFLPLIQRPALLDSDCGVNPFRPCLVPRCISLPWVQIREICLHSR